MPTPILFFSRLTTAPRRWLYAFPELRLIDDLQVVCSSVDSDSVCFVDSDELTAEDLKQALNAIMATSAMVVVLSSSPTDEHAFSVFTLGAKGYCHTAASSELLLDVEIAVRSGGFWLPPTLLKRILTAAASAGVNGTLDSSASMDQLTRREKEVATAVARGFSNKEIAESLRVTERTVKYHLTSIFGKFSLRDRVQLALVVNRLL